MNRIEAAFKKGKAFIPFLTAGDPDLQTTQRIILEMATAGADIIEIGIPFSDPVAEGPVIQAADERALSGGVTTDKIFDMVREIRKVCDIPLAFMTYMNPVFAYGTERFIKKSAEYGIDALIVPDVPFEERDELLPYCKQYGVTLIPLIAPTSDTRIREIAREAQGFVYCVSSMGVTGTRSEITTDIAKMTDNVRAVSKVPCAIGFGISNPEQAAQMAAVSDGVIVGSAIVKIIAQHGRESVQPVVDYVREMKQAISG